MSGVIDAHACTSVAALRVWGRDAALASAIVGRAPDARESGLVNAWFMSPAQAAQLQAEIRSRKLEIVMSIYTEHATKLTVAVATLHYEGTDYQIEVDFGFGYPDDAAEFMFRDGNYSCDCNRRTFIREQHSTAAVPAEDDCGDRIALVALRIEHRAWEGK